MADDSSGLIKIGLFAAAGYLAYKQGWLSSLGIGALVPASPKPATPATPATPAAPAAPKWSGPSLDAIYEKMTALAQADGVTVTGPDAWDVYAVRAGGPNPMPAPDDAGLTRASSSLVTPVFPAPSGIQQVDELNRNLYLVKLQAYFDAQKVGQYTAAQYWAAMAPVLKAQHGLAGLGFYGGLGALMRCR